MKTLFLAPLATAMFLAACSITRPTGATQQKDDGIIEVVLVQVNDVYEIAPVANGTQGGMARVATLKKQWQATHPNTLLVMAGDFLSPSVYNSLTYEGARIRGRQMVEAMNAAGVDYAVFGNHEFDIKEEELQQRINESQFKWVATNTFHHNNGMVKAFARSTAPGDSFPQTVLLRLKDADGTTANIGLMGLTLPFNKASYVAYTNPVAAAAAAWQRLHDSADAIIAITHQEMESDVALATQLPGLTAILGGHEHDMRFDTTHKVPITKAHANARSAFVIKLVINKNLHTATAQPHLVYLNEAIVPDSATARVVLKWTDIANQNFGQLGFNAQNVIVQHGASLDGREAEVRAHPTNLTRLIVQAAGAAMPTADVVLINAGSIRLDDLLNPPVTEYDIIRTLPFGGGLKMVSMTGVLLQQVLNAGETNMGTGGYLLRSDNISKVGESWLINGKIIEANATYRVALTDFLLTGGEANLGFLKPGATGLQHILEPANAVQADIRLAVIHFLQR